MWSNNKKKKHKLENKNIEHHLELEFDIYFFLPCVSYGVYERQRSVLLTLEFIRLKFFEIGFSIWQIRNGSNIYLKFFNFHTKFVQKILDKLT